jgi:hypothetical protein
MSRHQISNGLMDLCTLGMAHMVAKASKALGAPSPDELKRLQRALQSLKSAYDEKECMTTTAIKSYRYCGRFC